MIEMPKKSKHFLKFKLVEQKPKTKVYDVVNTTNNVSIGKVKYYRAWRKYVLEADKKTVWSNDCLQQVEDFTNKLNKEQKLKRKKRNGSK